MSAYRLYQPTTPNHAAFLGTIKATPETADRMQEAGLILVDAADPDLK